MFLYNSLTKVKMMLGGVLEALILSSPKGESGVEYES